MRTKFPQGMEVDTRYPAHISVISNNTDLIIFTFREISDFFVVRFYF